MRYPAPMAKRGPRTEAGKRKSALNALTHGVLARTPVIPGVEAEAEWERHIAGFRQSLAPANEFEAFLVESIAHTAWRLKRLELYENEMLALAQINAEELAAARILQPYGGAVSLRGATAASVIAGRIEQLRRLSALLLALQASPAARPALTVEDVKLLYEGLNLAITRDSDSTALQRQLIKDLSTPTPAEDERARDLAANVAGLLAELYDIVGHPTVRPAHPQALEGPSSPAHPEALEGPAVDTILGRYPVELVLVCLLPELQRLEHRQHDLDATIARIRRESLILEAGELTRITRYEAHLRRQLIQYLHELEARQSQHGPKPASLARLDVHLVDS